MGAGTPPTRERFDYNQSVQQTDVKTQSDSSTTAKVETETKTVPQKQESKSPEDEITDQITEEDLKGLTDKTIPYNRFKEVNDKAKSYEKTLTQTKAEHDAQLRTLIAEYEAKLSAQKQLNQSDPYEYEDESSRQVRLMGETIKNLQNEITSMKGTYRKNVVKSELDKLQQKYTNADRLAVQGWHQVYPEASLEELMEKSHIDNTNRIKNYYTELIEKKKARAKNPQPLGTPRIRLKPDERPRSFKEATEMAKRMFSE